jgi:hypothetical protein
MPNPKFAPIVIEQVGGRNPVVKPSTTPSIPGRFTPQLEEQYVSFVLEVDRGGLKVQFRN